MKRALGRLVIIVLVVGLLAAGVAIWGRQRLATPYRGFEGQEVFVELPPGTGRLPRSQPVPVVARHWLVSEGDEVATVGVDAPG